MTTAQTCMETVTGSGYTGRQTMTSSVAEADSRCLRWDEVPSYMYTGIWPYQVARLFQLILISESVFALMQGLIFAGEGRH